MIDLRSVQPRLLRPVHRLVELRDIAHQLGSTDAASIEYGRGASTSLFDAWSSRPTDGGGPDEDSRGGGPEKLTAVRVGSLHSDAP